MRFIQGLNLLDALASLGFMLESQCVTESFMFVRFCQILGISSGYLQGIFRVGSVYGQGMVRVCSGYVQGMFRVCPGYV